MPDTETADTLDFSHLTEEQREALLAQKLADLKLANQRVSGAAERQADRQKELDLIEVQMAERLQLIRDGIQSAVERDARDKAARDRLADEVRALQSLKAS